MDHRKLLEGDAAQIGDYGAQIDAFAAINARKTR